MRLLSPGCACHAVWPQRPLLPAVGGGGLLRWTLATPAPFSFQTWSASPGLPRGRGSAGPRPVDRYPPKNCSDPPPHIPTLCGLGSNGSREGPLITWSGLEGCFSRGRASLSWFSGRLWRSRLMPLASWVGFSGGRMAKTRSMFCTPALERWGVREERLFL